jgi:OOP family OmpA-OmpF porin
MKRTLAALAAASGFIASTPALAQGWYGGLSVGQARIDVSAAEIGLDSGSLKGHPTAFGARVGYEVDWYGGIEAGFYNLGKYGFSGSFMGLPAGGQAKVKSYNLGLVGNLPLGNQFSAYGKLAIARTRFEVNADVAGFSGSSSDWENEAMYGVGVKWMPNPQWGVFAEWMRYHDTQIETFQVGGLLKFQ